MIKTTLKACRAVRNSAKDILDNDISNEVIIDNLINSEFPASVETKKKFRDIARKLKVKHGKEAKVDQSEVDAEIEKEFGKDPERYKLIFHIHSMLGSNPRILEQMLGRFQKHAIKQKGVKAKVTEAGKRAIFMEDISIEHLRAYFWAVRKFANAKSSKYFSGAYGQLLIMYGTPREMRDKDKTGAIAYAEAAFRNFASIVQQHVSNFIGTTDVPGMNDILQDVKRISSKWFANYKQSTAAVDIFTKLFNGWMTIENGEFFIYSERGPMTDRTLDYDKKHYIYDDVNGVWKYTTTGDVVHDFNPKSKVSVKDYIAGKTLNARQKKEFDSGQSLDDEVRFVLQTKEQMDVLDFNAERMKKMEKHVAQAREIHARVFKDVSEKYKVLEKNLKAEVEQWIPGIKEAALKKLYIDAFFKGDFSKIPPQHRKRAKFLYENFGQNAVIRPFLAGHAHLMEKKGSSPVMYYESQLPQIYDRALWDITEEIKLITNTLIPKLNPSNLKARKHYLNRLEELATEKNRVESVVNRMDELTEDMANATKVYTSKDARSLRHITNAIDTRNMRTDEAVYTDYLRGIYGTLERGMLAVSTMESLRMAKGDKLIEDYIMGGFKTVLHKPDARASFFGMNASITGIKKVFFNNRFISVDEYRLDRYVRTWKAYVVGKYLNKISTAVLNKTVTALKIMNHGWITHTEAYKLLENEKIGKVLEKFLVHTGALDFGEFFSKSLVNDLSGRERMTDEQQAKMALYMLQVHDDIHTFTKKGLSKEAATKRAMERFFKKVKPIAKNMPQVLRIIIPEKGRLRARRRALREKRVYKMMNKWANWAITKDYSAMRLSEQSPGQIKKLISGLSGKFEAANKKIYDKTFMKSLTISSTEKQMRTLSYIMAITQLQDSEMFENKDFIDELIQESDGKIDPKDTERIARLKRDKELAKDFGDDFTMQSDFGLSTNNTGEWSRVGGGIFTQFTLWTQQKFGWDVRVFRDYYRSMTPYGQKTPIGRATFNLINELVPIYDIKNLKRRQRKTDELYFNNPHLAKIRNFILYSGTATLLMDLVIYGPLMGPILRRMPIVRSVTGMKLMSGVTSDLLSLMIGLPAYLLTAIIFDEDEEDVQETLYYKFRRIPIFGFGVGMMTDLVWAVLAMAMDVDDDVKAKRLGKAVTYAVPTPPVVGTYVDFAVKEGVNLAID